jgi:electron transfer flavoprotein beta subunit
LKIIVCIKQVPEVSELRFDNERKTLIREGVHNEINPFDRRAITFASETKQRYGGDRRDDHGPASGQGRVDRSDGNGR